MDKNLFIFVLIAFLAFFIIMPPKPRTTVTGGKPGEKPKKPKKPGITSPLSWFGFTMTLKFNLKGDKFYKDNKGTGKSLYEFLQYIGPNKNHKIELISYTRSNKEILQRAIQFMSDNGYTYSHTTQLN